MKTLDLRLWSKDWRDGVKKARWGRIMYKMICGDVCGRDDIKVAVFASQ